MTAFAFALALPLLVGADLWRDGRRFWVYSPKPSEGLYRSDAIIARLQREPKPYRVLNLQVYPHNVLMAHDIAQVLGYQGQELRYYDELLGGRNEWRYLLTNIHLWNLLAVRFVILPDSAAIPGYHRIMGPTQTSAGVPAYLYEADSVPPYARVVTAAAKLDDQVVPATLSDPRMPGYDRVVLLPLDAPVTAPPLSALPPPSASRARVTAWRTGAMTVELDPAPTQPGYVLISENWYVDWRGTVDGQPGQVLRGDHALLTVPVAPGARKLELTYHSKTFARGMTVGLFSLIVVLAGFIVPPIMERRRRGPTAA
jgi:hypothetical protein